MIEVFVLRQATVGRYWLITPGVAEWCVQGLGSSQHFCTKPNDMYASLCCSKYYVYYTVIYIYPHIG